MLCCWWPRVSKEINNKKLSNLADISGIFFFKLRSHWIFILLCHNEVTKSEQ